MTFFLEVRNDSDKDCSVADRQETGFQITFVQSITKYFYIWDLEPRDVDFYSESDT